MNPDTKEKPFTCSVCSKDFARADLLKRHAQGHLDGEQAAKRQKTSQTPVRTRVARACVPCAESKLKCEGTEPCSRCLQKDIVCEYSQPRSKKTVASTTSHGVEDEIPQPSATTGEMWAASKETDTSQALPPTFAPLQRPPTATSTGAAGMQLGINSDTHNPSGHLSNLVPVQLLTAGQLPDPLSNEAESLTDFNDLALADFLTEVMMPATPMNGMLGLDVSQAFSSRDVLDFNLDTSVDLPGMPGLPNTFPYDPSHHYLPATVTFEGEPGNQCGRQSGYAAPRARGAISVGAQASKDRICMSPLEEVSHFSFSLDNLLLPETLVYAFRSLFCIATYRSFSLPWQHRLPLDSCMLTHLGRALDSDTR